MATAQQDPRGGYQPSAPQNNYQVSATGGAGNGGQPARYMAGGEWGEGGNMELQTSAPMSKSGVNIPSASVKGNPMRVMGSDVTPLAAPNGDPNVDMATTASVSASMLAAQNSEDVAKLASYLPVYQRIADSPKATNATRNFYRWLRSQVV